MIDIKNLSGKTAVVTGGGTGIGRGTALALAKAGCQVIVTGRREGPLTETVAACASEPGILARPSDVADPASVSEFFGWAREQLGQIDILINSAGVNVVKRSMAELSPEDWKLMMEINATGAFNTIREVLPRMRSRGDGLIVNISSIAGKRASLLGGVGYTASKFAMSALGMTVACEDGPKGIRVTNIYPGEVETPILDNRPEPVSAEHRARILQPEDVAAAVMMVVCLPPRAHVPELIIKPTTQPYV